MTRLRVGAAWFALVALVIGLATLFPEEGGGWEPADWGPTVPAFYFGGAGVFLTIALKARTLAERQGRRKWIAAILMVALLISIPGGVTGLLLFAPSLVLFLSLLIR